MVTSRFWSAFWRVAGFLFLMGWFMGLMDLVLGLFGVLDLFAPQAALWLRRISHGPLLIWGALTFIDWRWGWKSDNAGLRWTGAAVFGLIPGLLAGAVAAVLAHVVNAGAGAPAGLLSGGALNLTTEAVLSAALLAVQVFASELIYRGVVISRFKADLSGRGMLLLAVAMPFVWTLAQAVVGRVIYINDVPSTWIVGPGTAALSAFLSLLFLRTDSVWLTGGLHAGLLATASLSGLAVGRLPGGAPAPDTGLLLIFGIPAAVLLLRELATLGRFRRPGGGGGRGERRRAVYGRIVRGPWGPH